ncbi:MAG: hypothetical protein FWH17_03130 [Oscillospiraceae bacterium]|nr:hypothetical protein [Oscillospiraceae bacterium]
MKIRLKTRFEKTLRITSDLMLYCHHHDATNLTSHITEENGTIRYEITASPVCLDEHKLDELRKRLDAPRQREMECDFWELMGESQDFSELTLVGMLCDESDVSYENSVLTITLLRYD